MCNSKEYPEAWEFFKEHARNVEGEEEGEIAKYRIPKPDKSGEFIYHNNVGVLFHLFRIEFYKPSINSPSVYGKIQYIVDNF